MKRILFRKLFRSRKTNMKDTSPIKISLQKRLYNYRRFFCLLFLFLITLPIHSQENPSITKTLNGKKSIYFTWDSKTTFITNEYAQVKSIKLGLDFGGKTKFGLGYNWYKGSIVREFDFLEGKPTANLKFRYVSLFAEHVYFINKRWEASIPAQIGLGTMHYQKEFSTDKISGAGGAVFIYEPSSVLIIRFLKYFGAGLGLGYRLAIQSGSNPLNEQLHSPIIMVRTKLYFNDLVNDFKELF